MALLRVHSFIQQLCVELPALGTTEVVMYKDDLLQALRRDSDVSSELLLARTTLTGRSKLALPEDDVLSQL